MTYGTLWGGGSDCRWEGFELGEASSGRLKAQETLETIATESVWNLPKETMVKRDKRPLRPLFAFFSFFPQMSSLPFCPLFICFQMNRGQQAPFLFAPFPFQKGRGLKWVPFLFKREGGSNEFPSLSPLPFCSLPFGQNSDEIEAKRKGTHEKGKQMNKKEAKRGRQMNEKGALNAKRNGTHSFVFPFHVRLLCWRGLYHVVPVSFFPPFLLFFCFFPTPLSFLSSTSILLSWPLAHLLPFPLPLTLLFTLLFCLSCSFLDGLAATREK